MQPAARLFAQQMVVRRFTQLPVAVAAKGEMEIPVQMMRAVTQLAGITAQTIFARENIRRVQRSKRQRPSGVPPVYGQGSFHAAPAPAS